MTEAYEPAASRVDCDRGLMGKHCLGLNRDEYRSNRVKQLPLVGIDATV